MRKAIVAATVGLLLVAGQAAAAGSNSAVSRIADRVGAQDDGYDASGGIPVQVWILGGIIAAGAGFAFFDDGDSN